MKQISDKQIQHLAELSALTFSDAERSKMKTDLGEILTFVDEINKCDLKNQNFEDMEVTLNDLRKDAPKAGLTQKQATANAPESQDGYFVVSKVVD